MTSTVTKDELITRVSEATNQPKDIVRLIMQQTFDSISDFLVEGRRLELRRFGVFHVRTRKPRVGRNPNAPEVGIAIPPAKVPGFKSSIILKKLVRGEKVE